MATLIDLIDTDRSGYITVVVFVGRVPRIAGAVKGIDDLTVDYKLQRLKVQLCAQLRRICRVGCRPRIDM